MIMLTDGTRKIGTVPRDLVFSEIVPVKKITNKQVKIQDALAVVVHLPCHVHD